MGDIIVDGPKFIVFPKKPNGLLNHIQTRQMQNFSHSQILPYPQYYICIVQWQAHQQPSRPQNISFILLATCFNCEKEAFTAFPLFSLSIFLDTHYSLDIPVCLASVNMTAATTRARVCVILKKRRTLAYIHSGCSISFFDNAIQKQGDVRNLGLVQPVRGKSRHF